MKMLQIKFNNYNDEAPVFGNDHVIAGEAELIAMAALERGMQSGDTSVSFLIETPHGKYFAQCGFQMLRTAMAGIEGADHRWRRGMHPTGQDVDISGGNEQKVVVTGYRRSESYKGEAGVTFYQPWSMVVSGSATDQHKQEPIMYEPFTEEFRAKGFVMQQLKQHFLDFNCVVYSYYNEPSMPNKY